MKEFHERLRQIMDARGMTQKDLVRLTGFDKGSISSYLSGNYKPKQDRVYILAKVLNVSEAWLMGFDLPEEDEAISLGLMPIPGTVRKPKLGRIACGEPIMAEENIEGYEEVPTIIDCDYILKCEGDSMVNARIKDGDIVYIKLQETVENGQIAAVRVGDETTLKRFYKNGDTITLMPENPAYAPMVFVKEQMNEVRIIGRAVAFVSSL